MTCTRCGKELNEGSVFNAPMCKSCAVKITVKDFVFHVVLSLGIAYLLYWVAGQVFAGSTNEKIFTILLVGFPFGARRMFMWIIPGGGHGVAASIGILLLNIFAGALIGWFVLAYNVITTTCKTIYRVIRILTYRPKPGIINIE